MDNLELAATAMAKEIEQWLRTGAPDIERIRQAYERMARILRLNTND